MYPEPDALAKEVIEQLKGRGYEKIMNVPGELSDRSFLFLRDKRGDRDERGDRVGLIEKYGPLCLWDVSEHDDLSHSFTFRRLPPARRVHRLQLGPILEHEFSD
jgi:hypothetical protein